jgi:hypothetical protein
VPGAKADFGRAHEIYNALDEPEFAAQAKWEELLLEGSVPEKATSELSKENYRVRVSVVESFIKQESKSKSVEREGGSRVIARRSAPPRDYWKRVIKAARRDVQISSVEW